MHRLILLSLGALFVMTSCETTGDPSQGGLFGWSEGKAQGRSASLQQHLNEVNADTAYQKSRSRTLEQKKADLDAVQ